MPKLRYTAISPVDLGNFFCGTIFCRSPATDQCHLFAPLLQKGGAAIILKRLVVCKRSLPGPEFYLSRRLVRPQVMAGAIPRGTKHEQNNPFFHLVFRFIPSGGHRSAELF
jgi:hypothetical protein